MGETRLGVPGEIFAFRNRCTCARYPRDHYNGLVHEAFQSDMAAEIEARARGEDEASPLISTKAETRKLGSPDRVLTTTRVEAMTRTPVAIVL